MCIVELVVCVAGTDKKVVRCLALDYLILLSHFATLTHLQPSSYCLIHLSYKIQIVTFVAYQTNRVVK